MYDGMCIDQGNDREGSNRAAWGAFAPSCSKFRVLAKHVLVMQGTLCGSVAGLTQACQ